MIRETIPLPLFRVVRYVEAVSFWGAVVLPLIYIPLLVLGVDTVKTLLVFISLIALNVLLLIMGHSYRQ